MRITMEHYRDFIGTLAHKRAELNTEIKAWEHSLERGEVWDWEACELDCLRKNYNYYEKIQKYFLDNTDCWAEFESLEVLKEYTDQVVKAYKGLDEYSKVCLPVDGQPLVGISDEEWDRLEDMRWNLGETSIAWSSFAEFCEYGEIL